MTCGKIFWVSILAAVWLCVTVFSCENDTPSNKAKLEKAENLKMVYLLRHAEKADDESDNPPLNEAGKERAERLRELLQRAGITSIYATPYDRTRNTALPLAQQLQLPIKEYVAHDMGELDRMVRNAEDTHLLIVGHSNTIPDLVNDLIGEARFEHLDKQEYDKLFVVVYSNRGVGNVSVITF